MDVEINPPLSNEIATSGRDTTININNIIEYLITNENICFKNQQRNETDLTSSEKKLIAREIFDKSKSSFLVRFGKFLKQDQLSFFRQYAEDDDDEVQILLNNLSRFHSHGTNKSDHGIQLETKNRRYEALKQLIQGNSYFTETEMMKRNPLLYHQLVGQYLSEEERMRRDRNEDNDTLVKILMEGIERDEAERKMRLQQEEENNAMEESDSDADDDDEVADRDPPPSTSRWGEFPNMQTEEPIGRSNVRAKPKEVFITSEERQLLKHEFITLMYQQFLDGKDDFDYATIDNNDEYDNIEILEHDEEDRYFDSEEPEDLKMQENEESSEDELDIYMNALNQHPAVCKLSKELEKL